MRWPGTVERRRKAACMLIMHAMMDLRQQRFASLKTRRMAAQFSMPLPTLYPLL